MNAPMTTAVVAKAVSVHPNTIRMYEACGFLPVIPRGRNGYRQFSERHLDQARLIRLAYCGPYSGGTGVRAAP
jgi:DNA-binding transcriptional MerR regulator